MYDHSKLSNNFFTLCIQHLSVQIFYSFKIFLNDELHNIIICIATNKTNNFERTINIIIGIATTKFNATKPEADECT